MVFFKLIIVIYDFKIVNIATNVWFHVKSLLDQLYKILVKFTFVDFTKFVNSNKLLNQPKHLFSIILYDVIIKNSFAIL